MFGVTSDTNRENVAALTNEVSAKEVIELAGSASLFRSRFLKIEVTNAGSSFFDLINLSILKFLKHQRARGVPNWQCLGYYAA